MATPSLEEQVIALAGAVDTARTAASTIDHTTATNMVTSIGAQIKDCDKLIATARGLITDVTKIKSDFTELQNFVKVTQRWTEPKLKYQIKAYLGTTATGTPDKTGNTLLLTSSDTIFTGSITKPSAGGEWDTISVSNVTISQLQAVATLISGVTVVNSGVATLKIWPTNDVTKVYTVNLGNMTPGSSFYVRAQLVPV